MCKNDCAIEELRKERIITALSKFDEQKLTLALMHAENYLKYGIDITEKIDTATKNAEMIYKAEHQGYCKCLEDMRKKDGEQE